MLEFLKAQLPGIFSKRRPAKRGGAADATDLSVGNVRYAFERMPLPGPGAMNAAFKTLGLPPESPISSAVAVRGQLAAVAPAQLATHVVVRQPTPTESGSYVQTGLIDPASGFGYPHRDPSHSPHLPVIRF